MTCFFTILNKKISLSLNNAQDLTFNNLDWFIKLAFAL